MFASRIRFRRIQEVSDDLLCDSIAIGSSSLLPSPSGSRSHSPSSSSPIPSSVVGYAARGMRRCNIRRLFTFAFFIFATTLLILSLPKENFGREWADPPHSQEAPYGIKSQHDEPLVRQKFDDAKRGAQRPLPHQVLPPSIDKNQNGDPFDFPSSADRITLTRIKEHLKRIDLDQLDSDRCKQNMTLSEYWLRTKRKYVPEEDSWEKFYAQIGSCSVYTKQNVIDELLRDLNRLPIKSAHIMDGGTQVKLVITFSNDKQAVFKPMRFGRDYESDPNHFYFSDFERHNAEIATFHLDRVLGFHRAVPTVGRIVNMTSELLENAEKKLKKTFFYSPAKNLCFVSRCDYYCDTTHAICGKPDLKEGSMQVFLPDEHHVPRKHNRSPYRRTYSKKNQVAEWQSDMNYCIEKVKTRKQYAHGRRLLDLVDLHILDYLIGNQDRHHYESFNVFEGIEPYAIHLDNGRAFGRTDIDDDDILLPLRQCCVIRPSTLATLLKFYSTPKSLSKTLHESMAKDPVHPILAFKHYPAIERRLGKIVQYLLKCFDSHAAEYVVMNEYHNPNLPMGNGDEEERSTEEESPKEPPATAKKTGPA
ncbi:hypothetical protein WR25_25791 [Diploscapter pachys]|uniref:FAM20 C-terminal domain-containing protein n=1 Tax=Diploscapter pachys TaxID=2018661 RepID=A0A2A2JH19_9BILA|nr:hypothetical protein WR25_25791 [Diploscapter pachys]